MSLDFIEYPAETHRLAEADGWSVAVHRVGSAWGFTIWHGGRCVQGGYAWDWKQDDAIKEAERKYKELTR
jgi:hypothetical protein